MRFPEVEQLTLPCLFERVAEGKPHPDGRRYLPSLFFRLQVPPVVGNVAQITPPDLMLAVVDRHHRVDLGMVGQRGTLRLIFMLGAVRLQQPPYLQGLEPEARWHPAGYSMQPASYGRVVRVHAWEADRQHLAYEALYAELLLDIGLGTIGLRTSATGDNLEALVGKAQIEPGDWVAVGASRIDLLGFVPE